MGENVVKIIFILFIATISLTGCQQGPDVRREAYILEHASLKQEVHVAILDGNVILKMTRSQVIASWGEPDNKESENTQYGGYRRWIYYETMSASSKIRKYVIFFEEGKVSGVDQRILTKTDTAQE